MTPAGAVGNPSTSADTCLKFLVMLIPRATRAAFADKCVSDSKAQERGSPSPCARRRSGAIARPPAIAIVRRKNLRRVSGGKLIGIIQRRKAEIEKAISANPFRDCARPRVQQASVGLSAEWCPGGT